MGIILVSPDEKMHSYAIRLKFNTSDHAIDCTYPFHGITGVSPQPKLLIENRRNHTPATEQERKYKKEIMDATTPFHRF
ncbi:hypothetical protein Tco_1010350 [Tanacetum coccineum]